MIQKQNIKVTRLVVMVMDLDEYAGDRICRLIEEKKKISKDI
nr:4491_t:CDS:2 [Entrophospora candida]